ncbi:minichromosome maintenance 5 protein [Carex littledalei]|uniref:Minichromosome maintenance 5 protein n=1 Tax=Carex littledalei TaxID=544730 RepID=A0A833RH35_9POAL|nr:minichromosome maintenance 5 protein [Carex littledalei]
MTHQSSAFISDLHRSSSHQSASLSALPSGCCGEGCDSIFDSRNLTKFYQVRLFATQSDRLAAQAETQIKRRMGIGSHISERRLMDDLTRMGMNESIILQEKVSLLELKNEELLHQLNETDRKCCEFATEAQALMQAVEHELEVTVRVQELRSQYERQMQE